MSEPDPLDRPRCGRSAADEADAGSIAASVARAEAAVARLALEYPKLARGDVARARDALRQAASDPAGRSRHLRELQGILHNVKGQGGSFDFPLVTRIAHSLCRRLGASCDTDEAGLKLLAAHLDAIDLVLDKQIRGAGSAAAQRLAERLESLTELAGR